MTKQFPSVCVKHPNILIWSSEGIGIHRQVYGCYAAVISIHSKAYKKLIEKRKGESH